MTTCHKEFVNDPVPQGICKWPRATGNLYMTACHRDFVNDCVPPKSSQLMNFQKTLHLLEFSWNFAKIRHFNFLQFSWLGSQKSDPSIFSKFHDPGKRKKNQKPMKPFTFWKWKHLSKKNCILKMKTPLEKNHVLRMCLPTYYPFE